MKFLIFLIFLSSLIHASERQALRALYKDDQHQWIQVTSAQVNTCRICLDPGNLKSLSCHKEHRFHPTCIEQWREENNTCPTCRAEIKDSIVCTCIESMVKPAVCIPTCGLIVATIKSGERLANYMNLLEAMNPICEHNYNSCMCFCLYCMTSLAVGPLIHYATKRD